MKYFILFILLSAMGANTIASDLKGQEIYQSKNLNDKNFMSWYISSSIGEYDGMGKPYHGKDLKKFKDNIKVTLGYYATADKDFYIQGGNGGDKGRISGYAYKGRTEHPQDGEPATQTQMYRYMTWQMNNNLMNRSQVKYNLDTIMWFKVMLARLSHWNFDPSTMIIADVGLETDGQAMTDCKAAAQELDSNLPSTAGLNSNLLFDMAMLGHPEVAEYLLYEVGIDPNIVNCQNMTAVNVALHYKHTSYAKAIIEHPKFNKELLNLPTLIRDKIMDAEYYPTKMHQKYGLGQREQITAYDYWERIKIDFDEERGHLTSQARLHEYLLKNGARSGYEYFSSGLCMMRDPKQKFYSQDWIQKSANNGTFSQKEVLKALKSSGVADFTGYNAGRAEACYGWYVQVDYRCEMYGIDCDLKQQIIDYSPELDWAVGLRYYEDDSIKRPSHIVYKYYWLFRTQLK